MVIWVKNVLNNYLPIEERLSALAYEPNIVIQVQIVSVPMSWVNLEKEGDKIMTKLISISLPNHVAKKKKKK